MKTIQKITVIVFAFLLLNISLVRSDSRRPDEMGMIISLTGTPYLIEKNDPARIYVREGVHIYKGQTLFTDNKSYVIVQLEDESIITMNKNSQMTFDKEENPQTLDFNLVLRKGQSRFQVSKRKSLNNYRKSINYKKFKDFTVKTPTAYVGVRGSDFSVKSEEKGLSDFDREKNKKEITEVIAYADTSFELFSLSDDGEIIEKYKTIVTSNKIFWVEKNKPPEEKNWDEIASEIAMHRDEIRYQLFSSYKGIGIQEKIETELEIPEIPLSELEVLEEDQIETTLDEQSDTEGNIIDQESEVRDIDREDRIQKLPGFPNKAKHQT
jgi:hypothetical protein